MNGLDEIVQMNKDAVKQAQACEQCKRLGHKWRKTDDWLIDRCIRCGEERA